jgi:hypothetical protein
MKGMIHGDALTAQYTVRMGGRIRATCIYTFTATRKP